VIGRFLAILGLSAALSSEYQSNQFMRLWFTSYGWPLGYLLGNYLGSVLIGIIGTILILWRLVVR
jgi:fluoride ion exporter CrcB/FEX